MSDRPLVLVTEDDLPIRHFLRASLSSRDYRVNEAGSVHEAKARASGEPPDLIVLDLGLPDGDGLDIIEWFREWSQAPVIVLSARGQEADKVTALDRGADDYLTKPFGAGELLARVRVALRNRARRHAGEDQPLATIGDLCIDLARREVMLAGNPVQLHPHRIPAAGHPGAPRRQGADPSLHPA